MVPVSRANVCKIPIDTDDDCSIAVSNAPTSTPRNGLVNITINSRKAALSFNPSAAFDIIFIPNINSENPSSIVPNVLFLSDFVNITSTTPIIASTGVKKSGLKTAIIPFPLRPERLSIQPVAVVPIFAPIITPIACESFIIPELTNPTSMTVVAAED